MLNPSDVLSHISFLLVFTEGVLSFFSPCVLPLLPIYMGYLAGHSECKEPHPQRRVLLFTLCFILGIYTAIFLMNIGITFLSGFFKDNLALFAKIGGILIVVLGLHQLGFLKFKTLERTFKIGMKPKKAMNIFVAFAMGFTFSFAWTPCIGPALSSILILASSSQSFWISNLLMLVYALGLTIPFLILGIFTNKALSWIAKHRNIMNYTVKIGAVILIFMGIMMFTGKMNSISNYLTPSTSKTSDTSTKPKEETPKSEAPKEEEKQETPPLTFALNDQHGNQVAFEDYRGKVIFLNFWATWCPPCKAEMPHIQELYEKYKDSDQVAILTIVLPGGQEQNADGIKQFLKDNNYSMPVLFDDGQVSQYFQIYSYPTTWMIQKNGVPYGLVKGQISPDIMEQIIEKTLNSEE